MRNILLEALAIGFILLIIFVVIHSGMMLADKHFSMSHAGIFISVFLAGMLGHLIFEASGMNAKFCKTMRLE